MILSFYVILSVEVEIKFYSYCKTQQDALTKEMRMEEGRKMFQAFAARMFEQRVLSAYREQIAEERRLKLLQELEEETRQEQLREERKEREKEKKREKKRYVMREPLAESIVIFFFCPKAHTSIQPCPHSTTTIIGVFTVVHNLTLWLQNIRKSRLKGHQTDPACMHVVLLVQK